MIRIRVPYIVFWVFGCLSALGFVLDVGGALWWITLPALAVISLWYWFWGMKLVFGPADYATMDLGDKVVALLVGLVQLFIGVVFAVFCVTVLVKNWPATILAMVILGVVFIWAGREPKPKTPIRIGPPEHRELVPEPSHDPIGAQDWIVGHLSVLFLLAFGAATALSMALKRADLTPGLEFATLAAYVVVAWIHIVGRGEPGKPPYSVLTRGLYTFMTVVMTFVFVILLIVLGEAVAEFWMWVAPPAAILVALIVWAVLDARKDKAAAPRQPAKPRDDIVR